VWYWHCVVVLWMSYPRLSDRLVCSGHCTASTRSGRVHFLREGQRRRGSSQMTLGGLVRVLIIIMMLDGRERSGSEGRGVGDVSSWCVKVQGCASTQEQPERHRQRHHGTVPLSATCSAFACHTSYVIRQVNNCRPLNLHNVHTNYATRLIKTMHRRPFYLLVFM